MPSSDPEQRFHDILNNIARSEQHTAGMNSRAFAGDKKTYDAVERCLERISEASKKLGSLAEDLCPGVPWSQLRGLGIFSGMNYDRIERDRLWFMVERDLAPLKAAVEQALQRMEDWTGRDDY